MKKSNEQKSTMHYKSWILLLMLLVIPLGISAQNITVKGNVVDQSGYPVIGATVTLVGSSTTGTVTDLDGNFSLNVPSNSKLSVSYLGMLTQEVQAVSGKVLEITLKEDAQALDEVVVIGYGSQRRADLTGSVASISAKTLKDIPLTSAAAAISGRMAGVNVVTTQGSPDAKINIRVRGGGSITQSNDPLFIVDGFQVNNINDVPPGDIESIDVLKDASSTAIYGAKGANGVILITTKRGAEGKIRINFNASVGGSRMYNRYPVMSPYEYVYAQREMDPSNSAAFFDRYGNWEDINIYKSMEGQNWQNKIFGRTGIKQNYTLSMMGGDDKMTYNLSYIRDDEEYIMLGSEYVRDNVNVKLNREITKGLDMDFQTKLVRTVINGASVSSGSKLRDAIKYPAINTMEDLTEGDLGPEYDPTNISNLQDPYYNIVNEHRQQEQFANSYNAGLTWEILKGLKLRGEGIYTYVFNKEDQINLKNTGEAGRKAGQPVANRTYLDGSRWTLRSTLSYTNTFASDHAIDAMAGIEFNSSQDKEMEISSDYFPIDYTFDNVLAMWNNGSSQPTYTRIKEPSRTQSYFGRVIYNFKERYILNLTARADGTNVFAPGNKWGFFPAASAAWRISDEAFMASTTDWLSNLKLRAGYGVAGNARVGAFWRQSYIAVTENRNLYYQGEEPQSALQPNTRQLRNEELSWETKYSANAGLDIGVLSGKLNLMIDLYSDVTKDLILNVPLTRASGYENQYQNIGQTTNRGIDLTLDAVVLENKDYFLGMNFNIGFNKNNVDALYGEEGDMLVSSSTAITGNDYGRDNYRVFVGEEIGLIYGYKADGFYSFDDFTFNQSTKRWDLKEGVVDNKGVFSSSGDYYGPGHIKIKDLNKDGKIDADNDRTIIGRALPLFTGGFSLNGQWKGFDLAAMFNFSYGNDVLNANKIDYTTYSGSKRYQNMSTIMNLENRFTTIDPQTGRNIYSGEYANPDLLMELNKNANIWHPLENGMATTDWAVEDGSFIRFGNLTLGYTLPINLTRKVGVQNFRLYGTVTNLYCWTKYTGQDPEVDTSDDVIRPGTDLSAYPKARTYLLGVNVTF